MGKQINRGGTFVGFIAGVLVGLAAALAVAVYVTKVPIPFTKSGAPQRTPEQDAAEAQRNRQWDPNAPLYGRGPARAAASGTVTQAPPGTVTAAAPVAAVPSATAPAGRSPTAPAAAGSEPRPAVSADPLGDLARARGADPFRYFVQAGAFRNPEEAESQRARLTLAGVEAQVTEREQAGRAIYRVRLGPYESREEAERQRDRLEANGIEAALVRVQR